jgi:hypothetical protein
MPVTPDATTVGPPNVSAAHVPDDAPIPGPVEEVASIVPVPVKVTEEPPLHAIPPVTTELPEDSSVTDDEDSTVIPDERVRPSRMSRTDGELEIEMEDPEPVTTHGGSHDEMPQVAEFWLIENVSALESVHVQERSVI